MAASAKLVSPNAEIVSKTQALLVNCSAAKGLQNVLKSNLGKYLCYISSLSLMPATDT